MQITEIPKFCDKYKDNVKQITKKTLAVSIFEIGSKNLEIFLLTRDRDALSEVIAN